jgi:hypothetical protein
MLPILTKSVNAYAPPYLQIIELPQESFPFSERSLKAIRRSSVLFVDEGDLTLCRDMLRNKALKSAELRLEVLPPDSSPHVWIRLLCEHRGSFITRFMGPRSRSSQSLKEDLTHTERFGFPIHYYPSQETLELGVSQIRLPWYYPDLLSEIKVISNYRRTYGLSKLSRLIHTDATLAFDVSLEDLPDLVEHLCFMNRDSRRALALVSHHFHRAPMCWLTTLGEVHELIPQWDCQGSTTVYLEPDVKALRQLLNTAAVL